MANLFGAIGQALGPAAQGVTRGLLAAELLKRQEAQKQALLDIRRLQIAGQQSDQAARLEQQERQKEIGIASTHLGTLLKVRLDADKLSDAERNQVLPMIEADIASLNDVISGRKRLSELHLSSLPGFGGSAPTPPVAPPVGPETATPRPPLELLPPVMQSSIGLTPVRLAGTEQGRERPLSGPALPDTVPDAMGVLGQKLAAPSAAPAAAPASRFQPSAKTQARVAESQARVPYVQARTDFTKDENARRAAKAPLDREKTRSGIVNTQEDVKNKRAFRGPKLGLTAAQTAAANAQATATPQRVQIADRNATTNEGRLTETRRHNQAIEGTTARREWFNEFKYGDTGQQLNLARIDRMKQLGEKAKSDMSVGDKKVWDANMRILTQTATRKTASGGLEPFFIHGPEAREKARKSNLGLTRKYGLDPAVFQTGSAEPTPAGVRPPGHVQTGADETGPMINELANPNRPANQPAKPQGGPLTPYPKGAPKGGRQPAPASAAPRGPAGTATAAPRSSSAPGRKRAHQMSDAELKRRLAQKLLGSK
jgi:hypothetical protein